LSSPDYLARVRGRVDVERLSTVRVVLFGVGTVGSAIVAELAGCGVRSFCFVDGDTLEEQNISRHELKLAYIGQNKALAMARFLVASYPLESLEIEGVPRYVDGSMPDDELDTLIDDADIVVAATDNRRAQRRIAERALASDVPAVFPALYENGGGEVFVGLGPGSPCFLCWDAFRTTDQALRAVSALNIEASSIVSLAVQLTLGILDQSSAFARLLARPRRDRPAPNLFALPFPHGALQFAPVQRVPNCPMCQVGPSPARAATAWSGNLAASQLSDPVHALRENPALAWMGLGAAVIFIIAVATGNPLATLLMAGSAVGLPYIVLRPSSADVISRALQNDFVSVLIGLVDLALLVFSIATRNGVIILLLAVALGTSSTALFLRR
jgi:hypothetical protein